MRVSRCVQHTAGVEFAFLLGSLYESLRVSTRETLAYFSQLNIQHSKPFLFSFGARGVRTLHASSANLFGCLMANLVNVLAYECEKFKYVDLKCCK